MIIEFFGLSKSGKSTLKRKLRRKGYSVSKSDDTSFIFKIIFFLKHFFLSPLKVIFLFYKLNSNHLKIRNLTLKKKFSILKMRNFYLAGVLAKYQMLKKIKHKIYTDEFSLQSLFMILQKRSNKEEIRKIIANLPPSNSIFLFEKDKKLRNKAYQLPHPNNIGATLLPGSWIDISYAKKWMEIMENNFKIIKKIILEDLKENKNTPKLSPYKIYSMK